MFILRSFLIGTIFVSTSAFAQATTTTYSEAPFTDVPTNSVDFKAIEYLRTQKVIKGYMDGTFKPDTRINRAEFVEFIINPFILDINGKANCIQTNIAEAAKTVYFKDVLKTAWYAKNICFAKSKHIIDGYPDNTFKPGDSINFVEAAKIISNVFALNVEADQVGEFWFRPYVKRLSDAHAIPPTIKRTNQILSRAEMAQIVYRLKVDSSLESHMIFNEAGNTFTFRASQAAVVVSTPDKQTQVHTRPSRRSIVELAETRNAVRRQ